MIHRGPDDSGTYVSQDRRVGFGFRRLSIIDLSHEANQPMSTPEGDITVVFNGEIYNHRVLRREFEARGYRYRTRSDTESILYAYKEYGSDFVHKLLGMFALAVWDKNKEQLILARDRIGVKPLYYTSAHGQFIFGSEIKALLKHPAVHRELDEEGLYHYLTFLITPAPMTMFRTIHKLEPGHRLVLRSDGSIRKEMYWDPVPLGPQPSIDLNGVPIPTSPMAGEARQHTELESIATLRSLLRQSVQDRMMSDVPFGVFLSGGIDSSTNVALMAELMERPVDTYSVGFRDLEKYNELRYAHQIAEKFNTNHHDIIIDQKDAFGFLSDLVYYQDEPLADPVCIPLYFVSKLARQHGTIVVQIGEGSDELFAGYQSMRRELSVYRSLWKVYTSMPSLLKRVTHGAAGVFLRPRFQHLLLDYIRRGTSGDELFWGGAINFTETHKQLLLNGNGGADRYNSHRYVQRWHADILQRDPHADYLKRMIYVEFRNRLPELLLMRVDKMTMAASVEGRDPFLDHRLVEYAIALPPSAKVNGSVTKYILKKSVEGLIPDSIIHRRKQGFAAPVNEWLRGDWNSFLRDRLLNSRLARRGFFRMEYLMAMIDRHTSRKNNHGHLLWNLLNLSLWYDHWIEGSHG